MVALDHSGALISGWRCRRRSRDGKTKELVFFRLRPDASQASEDLRPLPFTERKTRLKASIERGAGQHPLCRSFRGGGAMPSPLRSACRMDLEGIVSAPRCALTSQAAGQLA